MHFPSIVIVAFCIHCRGFSHYSRDLHFSFHRCKTKQNSRGILVFVKHSMSNQGSIFKARLSRQSVSAATDAHDSFTESSLHDDSFVSTNQHPKSTTVELTKNQHYCFSKLPALPLAFESETLLNAYSDYNSKYSLVINQDSIHVWSYKSTDPSPLSIQFPLDDSSIIPLAILTRPSSGSSQDPGLVIINSSSGLVKFYESVQHAPALGLINNKLLELTIPINTAKGEYITLAENVEPAGIVVATSWKRCVLISLRDFKSKPQLYCYELMSGSNSSGFLSSIFGARNNYNEEVTDEIVSIKSGKITNHGLTQEIIVQDSAGGFNFFTYQLLSANGNPYIDRKHSYKHNLSSYLENNLDGFLPGSSLSIKFLDIWPLLEFENVYLGLCHIDENLKAGDGKNLLLLTIKIDSTGVLLYGSHKLLRYNPDSIISLANKPKLFLPSPGRTAFVTIDNSIIITDINTSYIHSQSTVSYYKPRWEDIVKLKSSVDVIGYGYENKSKSCNPALILITKNSGVLRLERFPAESDNMEVDEFSTNPFHVIKSHIEQGIFYSKSSEIEFDVTEEFDNGTIIDAVDKIIMEITDSSSPYLPYSLPSISDSLTLKVDLYQKFIEYCYRNFHSLNHVLIPKIVEHLEKTNVALKLWTNIDEDSTKLKEVLGNIIIQTLGFKSDEDVLRKFFNHGVDDINEVLTKFIEQLLEDGFSSPTLMTLLVDTMYDGIYLNEVQYIVGHEAIPIRKLWIFNTALLIRIEEAFAKEYCENNNPSFSTQRQENLVKLCEVLYYFVTSAIRFMQQHDLANDQLKEYLKWYKSRKYFWINALIQQNMITEAISIAEKYHDFSSLCQILESEKIKIVEKYGEQSNEYDDLYEKYSQYFETFQYDFASSLYNYHLKNDQIQSLLLEFTNYKHFLQRFFQENPKKTANISWIRYLLDSDFEASSKALITSSTGDDKLDNKELKYSLAKLSVLAANSQSSLVQESLSEAEYNLVSIRSQKKLLEGLVAQYNGEKSFLKFQGVLKSFISSGIDSNTVGTILEPSFQSFVNEQQLSTVNLMNYLTLIKPSVVENKGFAYALRVAGVVQNDNMFSYYSQVVWLRLLVLGDDWSFIEKAKLKVATDEHIKQKVHSTVLYKTFVEINADEKLVEQLDILLESGSLLDEREDDLVVRELDQSLLVKLSDLMKKYDFKSWIKSIEQEAKIVNL